MEQAPARIVERHGAQLVGGEAQVPFGGVKGSGVGDREMSKEGLHFFTELKTVFLDYTGERRSSNIY